MLELQEGHNTVGENIMGTSKMHLYIFLTQIWFGECNYRLLKVKNLFCVCLVIKFAIANLSRIYFCILEIFKTIV